jgi:transposase
VAIVPTRIKKAKDKAPVEKSVQIAENRIISKLRNQQFNSFQELEAAVAREVDIVNSGSFKNMPGSRLSQFAEIEKLELRPLPPNPFEYADWKQVRAGMDYHVQYEGFFYSVPYQYAGKIMHLRATDSVIEVFCGQDRVSSQARCYNTRFRYSTLPEHMPSNHRAIADWTPERFSSWAAKFGPYTQDYICFLMEQRDHPEQAFKTCAGILKKGESLSCADMETICRTAKEKNIYSYKYFNLLFSKMTAEMSEKTPIQHENLRGRNYYGGDTNA